MEHSPVRGTSRCAPGAFSLTAPVFRSSRAQKGAWCARDSTWAHGPGAHGESTILRRARSQPHHQQQKPRANQASNPGNTTHQPAATASTTSPAPEATRQSSQQPRQHYTPTSINRSNRSTNARSHTPTTSPTPKTTRQSSQQPRQHHTPTRSNRSTNARSHTPTASPTPEASTARINASCTAKGRRRTSP